jgi:hypothetical protein
MFATLRCFNFAPGLGQLTGFQTTGSLDMNLRLSDYDIEFAVKPSSSNGTYRLIVWWPTAYRILKLLIPVHCSAVLALSHKGSMLSHNEARL